MKNLNLFKIAIFSLLAFTTSCREELTDTSSDKTNIIDQAAVKNGRLYFPNKESLSATYKNLKKRTLNQFKILLTRKELSL
ncbi:MAG: hypothetical protein E6Q36_05930 [Chryseobacterium sp.]|nr:MAG: hypothetical protein E6Q36_05930 [Chryseobacterium sp.]